MENIIVPAKHLIIKKADCGSIPALETLIRQFDPSIKEPFISSMTLIIRCGIPPITGIHASCTIAELAARIYQLFNDIDIQHLSQGAVDAISIVLFYNAEKGAVIAYVGVLDNMIPMPAGTFMSNQTGHAG